jgi:hypothetical protein
MQGWSKVAEDTGAMKSAFSAMHQVAEDTGAMKSAFSAMRENKPEYTSAEKLAASKTAAKRALPPTLYGGAVQVENAVDR